MNVGGTSVGPTHQLPPRHTPTLTHQHTNTPTPSTTHTHTNAPTHQLPPQHTDANPNAPPTGSSRFSLSPDYSSPSSSTEDPRLVPSSSLKGEMLTVLEEIIEMLSIPEEAAGALMRCFKWNKEKVRCNYI